MEKISFITPVNMSLENFSLVKEYSNIYYLSDNSYISLASNVGTFRDIQQDSLAISKNNSFIFLALADGVGGLENGDKASYETVQIIKKYFDMEDYHYLEDMDIDSFEMFLVTLIYDIVYSIPKKSATTLSLAIIGDDMTFIANIGDGRIYTLSDDFLQLRTSDDSLAFKMYSHETKEERDILRFSFSKNIINNFIGSSYVPNIRVNSFKTNKYTSICLLSDGVTGILSEDMIKDNISNASLMVDEATYGSDIINLNYKSGFVKKLTRGSDNASAIIYHRK